MTFDNSKKIISLRIRLFAITIIFLGYLILAYVANIIRFPFLGLSDSVYTAIIAGVWVLSALLPMILNYQYVFISDDTEKIIIRYFNAGIVGGRKNSLEIDKLSFAGYNIETSFLGLRSRITLYQKFNEGVAKYPPVHISALSGEEKEKMKRLLNLYVKA